MLSNKSIDNSNNKFSLNLFSLNEFSLFEKFVFDFAISFDCKIYEIVFEGYYREDFKCIRGGYRN